MLFKTERFHEQFLYDVSKIVFKKKQYLSEYENADSLEINYKHRIFRNVRFIGSYPSKAYGKTITDIDFYQLVKYDEIFLLRLKQIFQENLIVPTDNYDFSSSSGFIFIRFHCGEEPNLIPPWSILDESGDCSFSYQKMREWLNGTKSYLPAPIYNQLETILTGETLSMRKLLKAEKLIESYASVTWTREDIVRGYTTKYERKYELLETLKEYKKKKVFKFIYVYPIPEKKNVEFCLVDMAIKDENVFEKEYAELDIRSFYSQEQEKLLKFYKRNLTPQGSELYNKLTSGISVYTGLAGRMELIGRIKKYKTLPEYIITKLEKNAEEFTEEKGIAQEIKNNGGLDEATVKKITREKMEKILKQLRPYVAPTSEEKLFVYEIRGLEAAREITPSLLIKRSKKGLSCPFFPLRSSELRKMFNIGVKALINPKLIFKCLMRISLQFSLDITGLCDKIFPNNSLRLKREGESVILYDGEKEIEKRDMSDMSDMTELQIKVLFIGQ